MRSLILLALVAICHVATLVRADTTFVDSNSIEEIAEAVCKNNKGMKQQLGRLSTLNKLIDFLGGLNAEHKLHKCRSNYLESIEQLAKVVETASDDVCGEEKLALIEDYHRLYVSKVSKHMKQQKHHNKAPKMVKLLFMRYATEVSSICGENALSTLANNRHAYGAEEVAKVEELRKFTDTLGMTNLKRGYRGIYLFWNMVDSLDLSKKDKFSAYIAKDGRSKRISMKMRDAKAIRGLQAVCQYQLKPVYGKTLLPVLRLVDIGYYPSGVELVDTLNTPSDIRSLFFAAQICETIMPIEVFEDESLEKNQFMALTTEEASQMAPEKLDGIEELKKLESTFEVTPRSANTDDLTDSNVTAIKLNIVDRSKVINLMLKQLLTQIKRKLKTVFKGMKVIRKEGNQEIQLDSGESLDKIDEQKIKVQVEGDEHEGELVRTRRSSFLSDLSLIILLPCFLVYWIVVTVLKVAFLTIPTIVLIPVMVFGDVDTSNAAFDFLHKLWTA